MYRYIQFVNLGKEAKMLVSSVTNDECTEDLDEVSGYIENAEETVFTDGD